MLHSRTSWREQSLAAHAPEPAKSSESDRSRARSPAGRVSRPRNARGLRLTSSPTAGGPARSTWRCSTTDIFISQFCLEVMPGCPISLVPKRGKCEISRLCRLLCGRAQPFRPTAKKRKTIKFLGSVSSRKAGGFPHSPCRPVADPVVTRKFHVASRRINNLRELSGEQGAEPHWPVASGCFTSAEASAQLAMDCV